MCCWSSSAHETTEQGDLLCRSGNGGQTVRTVIVTLGRSIEPGESLLEIGEPSPALLHFALQVGQPGLLLGNSSYQFVPGMTQPASRSLSSFPAGSRPKAFRE